MSGFVSVKLHMYNNKIAFSKVFDFVKSIVGNRNLRCGWWDEVEAEYYNS